MRPTGLSPGLVRVAVAGGKRLSELTPEELAEQSPLLDDEFYALLADGAWLEGKVSEGGTSLERVREQLQLARARLSSPRARARRAGCTAAFYTAGGRGAPRRWSAASCATASAPG